MSRRGYLALALLTTLLTLPVFFGASCPPPDGPPFIGANPGGTTGTSGRGLPPCEPNRVCVSIINRTCVEAEVVLYVHDGFDLENKYVTRTAIECCENPNATNPCPCIRAGSDVGELQLTSPELFDPDNRVLINGEIVATLAANGGRVLISFPCDSLKTVGVEVGAVGDLPSSWRDRGGPDYRCTIVPVDRGDQEFPEDVACGATIQYSIIDRNDCANSDLTVYRVNTDVSADCDDIVQQADDEDDE